MLMEGVWCILIRIARGVPWVIIIQHTAQPARVQAFIAVSARHPDIHRAEVGVILVGVAHGLHHRHHTVVEHLPHFRHSGVYPSASNAGKRQHLILRDKHLRTMQRKLAVLIGWDQGIEAVVAAIQFDKYHDFITGTACCAETGEHGVFGQRIDGESIIGERSNGSCQAGRAEEFSSFHC